MTATVTDDEPAATEPGDLEPVSAAGVGEALGDRGALGLAAVGVALLVGADAITDLLESVIPLGGRVRGAAGMPRFDEAEPTTLRILGALLVLGVVAHGLRDVVRHVRRGRALPDRWPTVAAGVLVVIAAGVHWYLGTPHNAWEGNARVHWVEIYNLRADDWFYALVKLPHQLFYEQPAALQALNGALNVALVIAIGRAMFGARRALPLAMGLAFLVSSSMLQFGTTSDDVHLSITPLLCAHLFHLQGRHRALGVTLMVATLARSQLITAAVALGLVEGVRALLEWRRTGDHPVEVFRRNPFLSRSLVVFAGLFAVWHAYLTATGRGWFLVDGQLVDRDSLLSKNPIDVGGFVISPFSGAYAWHALWLYPAPLIAAAVWATARRDRLEERLRAHLLFGMTVIALGLLVSEKFPLAYFNERYITYYWPSLLLCAFTALAVAPRPAPDGGTPARTQRWVPQAALVVVLALAPATTHRIADDLHDRVDSEPGRSLFAQQAELRAAVGDARVFMPTPKTTPGNYLMYALRRAIAPLDAKGNPAGSIETTPPGVLPPGGVVVTLDPDGYEDGELVWQGDVVWVFRKPTG